MIGFVPCPLCSRFGWRFLLRYLIGFCWWCDGLGQIYVAPSATCHFLDKARPRARA
ncbi:MAG TPA: hypothetical protein VEU74_11925 [Gemmatimonadales bacterium]|nr:hypothetical protein [Gemmatimonadales bacterium]